MATGGVGRKSLLIPFHPAWIAALFLLPPPAWGHGLEETGAGQRRPAPASSAPLRFLFPETQAAAGLRTDPDAGYRYIKADALPPGGGGPPR